MKGLWYVTGYDNNWWLCAPNSATVAKFRSRRTARRVAKLLNEDEFRV